MTVVIVLVIVAGGILPGRERISLPETAPLGAPFVVETLSRTNYIIMYVPVTMNLTNHVQPLSPHKPFPLSLHGMFLQLLLERLVPGLAQLLQSPHQTSILDSVPLNQKMICYVNQRLPLQ